MNASLITCIPALLGAVALLTVFFTPLTTVFSGVCSGCGASVVAGVVSGGACAVGGACAAGGADFVLILVLGLDVAGCGDGVFAFAFAFALGGGGAGSAFLVSSSTFVVVGIY